ncbi:FCD domain-containing protein [Azospirillum brasilense]|uniref:GntR family transcriptional regulator n=1 Tax=Azospirillum argentinense TaxID=2970906 RepID=UPI00190A1594|nr:GntR family transcriptional regulator [Azospirillum argentinense]MBK3800511.1 FCD domain-containing protein [Azospirillum argentinense]
MNPTPSRHAASTETVAEPAAYPDGREADAPWPWQADSQLIYRDLRNAIVSLHRRPGEILDERSLAEDYGTSRPKVRQAINRLSDEQLVERQQHHRRMRLGVARIPLRALPEAEEMRKALETRVARYAARRATPDQIAGLRASIERQRVCETAGDIDGFHAADEAFHALLSEAAGYPGFWTTVGRVKAQIDRCRRLGLLVLGGMGPAIAEHEAIAAAVAAHEPDRAATLMATHLDGVAGTIAKLRSVVPCYFHDPGDPQSSR